jgi:hypothetical protein
MQARWIVATGLWGVVKQQAADWEQDGHGTSRACLAYEQCVIATREEAIAAFWNLPALFIAGGRAACQQPAVPSPHTRATANGRRWPQRRRARHLVRPVGDVCGEKGRRLGLALCQAQAQRLHAYRALCVCYYPRHPQANTTPGPWPTGHRGR